MDSSRKNDGAMEKSLRLPVYRTVATIVHFPLQTAEVFTTKTLNEREELHMSKTLTHVRRKRVVPPSVDLIGGTRGHVIHPAAEVAALSTNDTAWGILYGALVSGIGANPQNFQLAYPMTSWSWPTTSVGFTSAAQYDFCSVLPQWSAVGAYVSSGTAFDGSYAQFLNCILPATTNPALQAKIVASRNDLTQATNQYSTDYAQAQVVYNGSVTGNNPSFTDWLASPPGFSFQTLLAADQLMVNQAQAVYNSLVNQATTPNLAPAQAAMANQAFYTKLQDPGLSGFPPVPSYSISTTAQAWVNMVQGGGGTPGTISFSNSQSSFNFNQTWAQTSATVSGFFWQVYNNNSWQQATLFESDSSLTCTVSFKAWDTIQIQPGKWYSGVTALKNGPYTQGFSEFKQPGMTWMFGQGGVVPLLKTSMLVCYQPSFTISVSQSTFQKFQSSFSTATGMQVGPFACGGASGGSSTLNWKQTGSSMTLTCASTSIIPLIFGINVNTLP
jgi:hypothetical protein